MRLLLALPLSLRGQHSLRGTQSNGIGPSSVVLGRRTADARTRASRQPTCVGIVRLLTSDDAFWALVTIPHANFRGGASSYQAISIRVLPIPFAVGLLPT